MKIRMNARSLSAAVLLTVAVTLPAQEAADADTLWKYSGVTSLNLSQLSLTNWAAGGENSVSGNGLLQLAADYDDGKLNWNNALNLGYGLIRQGESPTRKSDDKIDFSSKMGYKAGGKWLYSGLLSFRTQFAPGYDKPAETDRTKISNFLAPGYLNLSAGMDYKPGPAFSLFLSPVTGKFTFVTDEDLSALGVFGLEPGQKSRAELGGYVKMALKKEIMKNVVLDTKVDLFSNYLNEPQYIDVNWDLLLSFKVNQYISASLVTQMIYDHDIEFGSDTNGDGTNDTFEPRIQFKELFGIGFSYSF